MVRQKHDASVSSVSLDQGAPRHLRLVGAGVLDLELVQTWISTLLEQSGEEIFRMKGVLSIDGSDTKFVYQAVRRLVTCDLYYVVVACTSLY